MNDMTVKAREVVRGKVKMTPSEALVETLVAQGVTDIFGIVGSAYMDALDIDKSHGDLRKVALDLEKMGELRAKNGEVKDAISLYERSYIVRLNCHQTTEALNCIDRIIEAYRSMGNEEKAGFYAKIKLSVIENSADRKAGIR